ncbi:DUF4097 domain-containing protein [Bacillus sp. DTU_2020_1000418_1_SI_GHA_SEK_038]|uniref:DUF4097 family beta strand repeat-containing protein n=1 Tax=Bacillus sp. DTU_2020_1000418_1_SI_GHA_SEK_038 TaxID=3077585 RepID=UPI0028EE4A7B|nr:DUF4097 domain-containing protein [Bacillus sp. DTU_2020_1000418_1_SI_GHA_SEK_038]WNS75050.1 DUF4097 domain-containing protein [Bacillus sp. DTU_2020_1000418_1_SI_GHA_SEK_038]
MQAERKRILKMVEDGKLTVDEALFLLEELEKTSKTAEGKKEDLVQELSTTVKFEEAKKEEPFNYKFQSAKDKIIDFVDSAFKKIKDMDLDFNFGQSVEITHIFQQGDVSFKDVDVDVANGKIEVLPWEQKDVRIECKAKVYRVENQEEAQRNFLNDVTFAIEGQKLRFATQQKWMKVDAAIYIPQTEYDKVKIRMFNGAIDSQQLKADTFKAKTANGKITIQNMVGKYTELETANGQISIQKSHIEQIEAETLNGAIHVDGSYQKIDLHSFNGDVFCAIQDGKCDVIDAKAVAGKVELQIPNHLTVNGELKTNLGSLHVNLDGIQIVEDKSEVIQKVLRFQSVSHSEQSLRLTAETKTGAIHINKAKSVDF